MLLYKCMNSNGPQYINNFFQIRYSKYNIRGRGINLEQSGHNNKFFHNSFTYIVSRLWNKLPARIKTSSTFGDFMTINLIDLIVIRLINTNEKMKHRKIKAVLRYHKTNKQKEPELYFHHLLMLYYPWRDKGSLLGDDNTYMSKFYEPNVEAIVEQHREMFEPDAEAVTEALEWLRNNQGGIIHSYDSFGAQENADIQLEIQNESLPE